MTTYTVTMPDGTEFTRTSKRVYTHALIRRNKGSEVFYTSLASSEALAEREARVFADDRSYIEIVPLVNGSAVSAEAVVAAEADRVCPECDEWTGVTLPNGEPNIYRCPKAS